jgi:hypothetical protein
VSPIKHEWRKHEKNVYLAGKSPSILKIPEFKYFMISGEGNPNGEEFTKKIEALYSVSYGLKMLPKKGINPSCYYDYTVYPLEGIWDLKDEARGKEELDKDKLIYTIMIRQPDFLDETLAKEVIELVAKKKKNNEVSKVYFKSLEEGLCLQMMHIGSYNTEPETFAIMEEFCRENNLKRISKKHKEIYISDARKVEPEKLKTVLRFTVKESTKNA